ncbi:tyrosinase cofactor [Streptomyces ficellus]|uniref:Tyrosinase cofactor n=1 Tax=Streptomyces ficellus TaxID=1977088 RepID=A0ABT7Z9X1_9ACTN|nr:tyrosinase cofactor [Streptomyces ficellus]MDN3295856.1 tyrosinase cofactor [Streptomyces ficellus]
MSRITRRQALGVTAGAALGLTAAGRATAAPEPAAGSSAHPTGPAPFEEIFMGRRIKGGPSRGGGHHGGHHGGYSIRIDGGELHVMRNADGTWISVITHYEPVATPLAVARAAVRELQGAPLVPLTSS